MGCWLKANKSAVLVAKVQEMTDRYELAINENSFFFLIEIKFELIVFYLLID